MSKKKKKKKVKSQEVIFLKITETARHPGMELGTNNGQYGGYNPSHLFRISKNQAEPAGMKNFQNSRHIRKGISNPVTLEAEWAGMTAEWKLFIYS